MDAFTQLPECPGYSVSARGRVRSERSGLILSHDARGRVRLRLGGRYPSYYVGELLAMAGLMSGGESGEGTVKAKGAPAGDGACEAPEAAPGCGDETARRLALARRANGHLLALVEGLRRRIALLEAVAVAAEPYRANGDLHKRLEAAGYRFDKVLRKSARGGWSASGGDGFPDPLDFEVE